MTVDRLSQKNFCLCKSLFLGRRDPHTHFREDGRRDHVKFGREGHGFWTVDRRGKNPNQDLMTLNGIHKMEMKKKLLKKC